MERIIKYEITHEDVGKTIEGFLRSKGVTKQTIVELKKMNKSILIGDKWEYMTYRLSARDILTVHIKEYEVSENIVPADLPFPIVYEDEDIVVVNKPSGMPIHPSQGHFENSLANAAAYYYGSRNEAFVFRCINRLDRDTSGLTVIAKHMMSAGILYEQMAGRRLCREYTAIVVGSNLDDTFVIDAPIGRKHESTIERTIDYEKGDRAVTHGEVMARKENLCMVRFHLDTGRTHQIRVHMKSIGHPLIGDWLYNPDDTHMNRQALHACRLSFEHPINNQSMQFEVSLPDDMQNAWDFG